MISVVIIAKNSARTIARTLGSLQRFQEVIIYDNGSTDNTIDICKHFSNVKVIQGDFIGFGATKNKAATYARNEWIFSLDSDEYIDDLLYEEIMCQDFVNPLNIFTLKRDNYFDGKKIRFCGWGNDYIVRIYNKTKHSLKENLVHEYIETNKNSINTKLLNSFSHDGIQDINQLIDKMKFYTDLGSKDRETKWILVPIAKFLFRFFKTYIIKLGILEGYRGLFLSMYYANISFFKYFKRYLNYKKRKK
ncbi:MAG: Glycosyltransferase family 2 protein [uncultured Campylobacterales bacterium]|uniref:Glycosyltransferase family 2 protein n=1 Tax=uncultured Campylobacterales bacterium TaxID=352960 RepID=A0A6S6SLF8_9BACT|nr:MAG: Glycosyltransferase family 2 protein [uncultured Campylobacterales bacterium]